MAPDFYKSDCWRALMKGLTKMTLPHKCIKTRKPLKSKKKAIFGYFSMSHDSVRKRNKP